MLGNMAGSTDFAFALCLQDGRIDFNEFVAMMQKGNAELGKNGLQGNNFGIGFREALSVY
jgi:calcium-dependent protein kinase